jgi:hypothetical protein
MAPGQHNAAMIHHLRRGQSLKIVCRETLSLNQRSAAGRAPIRRGRFGQHGVALAANPLHSSKITGSGRKFPFSCPLGLPKKRLASNFCDFCGKSAES